MADTAYARTMAEMDVHDRQVTASDAAWLATRGLLTTRQYHIIMRRSFGESHGVIGWHLGLSRQRVAQIEKRTLEIMNQEAEKGDTQS